MFVHKDKFTTNDHHRPLAVKPEFVDHINLNYSQMAIEQILLNQGFRWSKTASKEKVAKIKVPFPIKVNGDFNLEAQKEIANKYEKVKEMKKIITKELKRIEEAKLDYE